AYGDLLGGETELALRVRHPQAGEVQAELVVGVGGLDAGGVEGAVTVEVPLVGEGAALGVRRRGGVELDLERGLGGGDRGGRERGARGLVALGVGDPVEP